MHMLETQTGLYRSRSIQGSLVWNAVKMKSNGENSTWPEF